MKSSLRSPYKAVIFDFDGTLCDTTEAIAETIRRAFLSLSLPAPQTEIVSEAVSLGFGLETTLGRVLRALGHEADSNLVEAAAQRYRELYGPEALALTRLYDGVLPLLERLRSHAVPLAVASNKSQGAVEEALRAFEIHENFVAVAGVRPQRPKKPDPRVFSEELQPHFSGLSPAQILMVGDTESDARFALACGFDFIWARYGFGKSLSDCPTVILVESVRNMEDWLFS